MPTDLPQQPGYSRPAEFVAAPDRGAGRPFYAAVPEKYRVEPAPAWFHDLLTRAGVRAAAPLGGRYEWRWFLDSSGQLWGGYTNPPTPLTDDAVPPDVSLLILAGVSPKPADPLAGLAPPPTNAAHPIAGLLPPR